MINDLGITNDNNIMNIIVKVRKKRWGQQNIDDVGIIEGIITSFKKKLPLQGHLSLVTHAHKVRLVRHPKAKVIDHMYSKCGETTLCIITNLI